VSGYDLEKQQDREDRRKHLELVSAIVARMAGASSAAKGWSVTVAGAAFGVAVVRASWYLFALGVGALLVFGMLDALYLHNERKFRDLYRAIVQNSVEPLSMDTAHLRIRSKRESVLSWSVLGFYFPLAVAGLILLIFSLAHGHSNQERSLNHGTTAPQTSPTHTTPVGISPPPTSAGPKPAAPSSAKTAYGAPERAAAPRRGPRPDRNWGVFGTVARQSKSP
jgi:hypothetical protein